jgi:ribosomal protein S18 acetylase RimI-like enzyme
VITFEGLDDDAFAAWRATIRDRLIDLRVSAGLPRERALADVDALLALRLEQAPGDESWVWAVLADGSRVGAMWTIQPAGQQPTLADLDVPPELVRAALDALHAELGARGATAIEVPVHASRADLAAAIVGADATLVATHMLRDLAVATPPPSRVRLVPFTEDDYATFTAASIDTYAEEIFKAGGYATPELAHADSVRQFGELLPDGLASAGQHLWAAYDAERRVGLLWIFVEDAWSYIYDIEMLAEVRGQGYGSEVLALGASEARRLGATHLGLNVFGHNADARRLYERSGFAVTREFFRIALTS